MNPMPQLRTVHSRPTAETLGAQSPDAPTRSGDPSRRPPEPGVDLTRVPLPARGLLTHLHGHGLLTDAELTRLLSALGERVRSLTTRERMADALVHFGLMTKYVRGRALAGHLGGLACGPYRVLDRAGAGTIGVVFLGEHTVLKRRVALKVLTGAVAEDHTTRERFLTEARALAALDHPHVVRCHDAGTARDGGEEFLYMAVEWAAGGDLEQHVYEHGPAGVAAGSRWGWQAAAGLHAAHRSGLVHRDVKPSNLLLNDAGHVKVSDFGLVRHPAGDHTPVNAVIGSLQFLAPEQLNDPTTAGPPADVYGLGVSLFWLMSGRLPRPDSIPSALIVHLRTQDADRLKTVLPDAPPEVDDLLARMLDRNPAGRPPLPDVMTVLAKFAAASGGQDAPHDADPRTTILQLEAELAEARQHRDDARRAILKALHATTRHRPDTFARGERVGTYAAIIAKHLSQHPNWCGYKLPAARTELAAVAALVDLIGEHDRAHPEQAAAVFEMLAELPTPLPFVRPARDAVKHHHEQWDGHGFPDGLKGTAIPPAARVIAVADVFDRLTCGPTGDPVAALAELKAHAGTAFDPDVIAAAEHAADDLSALILPVLELVPDEG